MKMPEFLKRKTHAESVGAVTSKDLLEEGVSASDFMEKVSQIGVTETQETSLARIDRANRDLMEMTREAYENSRAALDAGIIPMEPGAMYYTPTKPLTGGTMPKDTWADMSATVWPDRPYEKHTQGMWMAGATASISRDVQLDTKETSWSVTIHNDDAPKISTHKDVYDAILCMVEALEPGALDEIKPKEKEEEESHGN